MGRGETVTQGRRCRMKKMISAQVVTITAWPQYRSHVMLNHGVELVTVITAYLFLVGSVVFIVQCVWDQSRHMASQEHSLWLVYKSGWLTTITEHSTEKWINYRRYSVLDLSSWISFYKKMFTKRTLDFKAGLQSFWKGYDYTRADAVGTNTKLSLVFRSCSVY